MHAKNSPSPSTTTHQKPPSKDASSGFSPYPSFYSASHHRRTQSEAPPSKVHSPPGFRLGNVATSHPSL
jgi:hypothetical protein